MPDNTDNYIVTLHDGHDKDAVANEHSIHVHGKFSTFNGFHGHIPSQQLERLKNDPRVRFIDPDIKVAHCAQLVPNGVKRINTLNNSIANINGVDTRVNVDVAIIDSGVCLNHPDLNVVAGVDFTGENTAGNDNNGHGSHVAGIVGAIDNLSGSCGVAPGVRIWAVKVLNISGSGAVSNIIKGVEYVTQNASKISVSNMSLGGVGSSNALRLAVQSCVSAGVVVVVAAGNSRMNVYGTGGVFGDSDDVFPAAFPESMTVSAIVDTDGKSGGSGSVSTYGPDDTIASISNYSTNVVVGNPVTTPGLAIDVAAPGVSIYSTYKNNGYATMTGTSQASPHVAGAVALYIAEHGRATNAAGVYAIRQALINSAEPQSNWGAIQPCAYVSPRNGYTIKVGSEPLIHV